MYKLRKLNAMLSILMVLTGSCKEDWLEAKPSKSLVVPNSVANFQALLDNSSMLFNFNQPGLGEISSDNISFTYPLWQALGTSSQINAYVWSQNIDEGKDNIDWSFAYNRILSANIILEGIMKVEKNQANLLEWNNVRGAALFFRAYDFYNLAQQFCPAYNASTAGKDLGIPLKLTANVNEKVFRSSVKETYHQLITDLKIAGNCLVSKQKIPTRPTKTAVHGMLARVYLSMEDYENAGLYADSALMVSNVLMDYSTLSVTSTSPIKRYNPEVIYHNLLILYRSFNSSSLIVDPALYTSYEDDDLRKTIFFRVVNGNISVKSGYSQVVTPFSGIATDEMYLIRAECSVRTGKLSEGLNDLNKLLKSRWKKNTDGSSTYTDKTTNVADEALLIILNERRKELCYRGLRWADLRRLNKDERFKKTLSRNLNGIEYTLLPNSLRYVLPIPDTEIQLNNFPQNPR